MSPRHASPKLVNIFSGVGRNRSLIQPICVATHHSTSSASTVTTLISVLGPSPGTLYPLMARMPSSAPEVGRVADAPTSSSTTTTSGGTTGAFGIVLTSVEREWRMFHLGRLAQRDELRIRLHLARVAAVDEPATEIHLVAMCDAPRGRRHHDEIRREEQRFLDAVRDEEEHLARRLPQVKDEFLLLLAGERV